MEIAPDQTSVLVKTDFSLGRTVRKVQLITLRQKRYTLNQRY